MTAPKLRDVALALIGLVIGTTGATFGAPAKTPKELIEGAQAARANAGLPYIQVHAYQAPNNSFGYQIIQENETGINSYGYGVEAAERTWTKVKPVASTTP